MVTKTIEFILRFPTIIAILASVWWFYIGYDDLNNGDRRAGFQWQLLGVVLSLGFSIGSALSRMWISTAVAFPFACGEIALMFRWFAKTDSRRIRSGSGP
jgi:hypothetical protein